MSYGMHAKGEGNGLVRSILNLVFILVMVLILTWAMRTYVFMAYQIPSGSMEETIQVGDMVFSEKVSYYFRGPERGDIVTFDDPETPGRTLIKRVIATEGQTVTLVNGKVCINGTPLSEPYTRDLPSNALNSDISYPFVVPEGHVWVMGDNRTNSADSRFFGAVKTSSITGRAVLVYWPVTSFGLLE